MEKTSTFHDKTRLKQYLSANPALEKVIDRKLQFRWLVVPTKTQAIDNITLGNPKEENTNTHTVPSLTTKPNKISGINNHWSGWKYNPARVSACISIVSLPVVER